MLLLGSRTFRGDDLFCEWQALSATWLAPDRPIDAVGASGALARGLAHIVFANRIADTNNHADGLTDNENHSQQKFDSSGRRYPDCRRYAPRNDEERAV